MIHCPISPDPLPTAIFDGIESNTPVIYTNLGGSYEILDSGKNGLAIDHLSVKKSVESILEFIDNTFEQKKNIKNAQSFVEKNFQISSFNYSLKTLISKLSKKLKIAIIGSRGYPYVYSGYETLVKELSERLAQSGNDVTVYCHRKLFKKNLKRLMGLI